MKVSLKLPLFGMNMEEATVVRWHRQPGESFRKGEALYEIETEKVTTEVGGAVRRQVAGDRCARRGNYQRGCRRMPYRYVRRPRVAKRRFQRCSAVCAAISERAHLLEPVFQLLKLQRENNGGRSAREAFQRSCS